MTLSKETKIGILAIVALALGIWGFSFLKGRNLLDRRQTFYVRYANVDQLRPSSPVMISGLEVGMVKEMYIDPGDGRTVIAVLDIDDNVNVPKDARATIVGTGLMGGKAIELYYERPCSGDDCAQSEDFLLADEESFLETLIGDPAQLDRYTDRLRKGLTGVYDSLANPENPQGPGRTLIALEESLKNTALMTRKLNLMIDASAAGFGATARNSAEITRTIRENSKHIEAVMANMAAVSMQLRDAGFDKTTQKATQALDSISASLSALRQALNTAERAVANIDTLTGAIVGGDGFFGQMVNDRELYTNVVRTSRHLHLLLQDIRLNPRRYNSVKIRIFGGKKVKEYKIPMEDPAYELLLDSLEREYSEKVDSVEIVEDLKDGKLPTPTPKSKVKG
jgi:phospholipid/cholesterol/gamma-HCH transport system substrate-binding protein